MNIREASKEDIDEIKEGYRDLYHGDEKQKFYGSKIVLDALKSGQIILVAEIDKKAVGYCWAVWYEHIKNKGIAYIEELQVDDDNRSKGIGKALMKDMLSRLKTLSVPYVYCAVGRHMKESQEFYKHIGFSESKEAWFEKEL